MATFPITQAIRCNPSFGTAILDILPDLMIAEMRCDNNTLTILRSLTGEQVSAISNSIAAIKQAITLQMATKRANVDTFAAFRSREAQQWRRAFNPRRRN